MKRVTYSPKPIKSFRNTSQSSTPSWRKPTGLWYTCGNDWKKFVEQDMGYGDIGNKYSHAYELEINKSKMLVIDTPKKFLAFDKEYSVPDPQGHDPVIDWARVAKKYEGIEICPYFYEFRMDYFWYYSWDVASGCIWGKSGIKNLTEIPLNTKLAKRNTMKPSSTRVAYAYLEKQAQLEREAGLKEIWQDWVQTPIQSLIRNAPKFKKEAVDEVFDDIVRDVAPLVAIEVQKQVVEKLYLEFENGLRMGAYESINGKSPRYRGYKVVFPKYKRTSKDIDWEKEGYVLGYASPSLYGGMNKVDRKIRNKVMHGILMQEEDDVAENVIGDKMKALWDNINPVEVVKTIWKLVKQHGWKVGAALALVQIIESAVIPAVVTGLGHPELALISSQLPITEITIPIMAKFLNIEVGEPDIPTTNLDSYIEDVGSVKFAAVSFNTFEKTIAVISKRLKAKAKIFQENRDKSTEGNEFYAELGKNKISYDPVSRELIVNKKTFRNVDTKELLPTLAKNLRK